MEDVQARNEEASQERVTANDIYLLALNLESRGVVIEHKTLGEILYLEEQAHYRDRVNWACSAQNDKLLPPQKKRARERKQKPTDAIIGAMFRDYEQGHQE